MNEFIGGDKYLGLKYDNGRTVTYGWIRVKCITEASCFIKDLSHTSTTAAVNEISQKEVILYPYPGIGICPEVIIYFNILP